MREFERAVRILVLASVALVSACSGGSGGTVPVVDDPVESRSDGILFGTITRNAVTYDLTAIVSGSSFLAYETPAGRFYRATFSVADGVLSASTVEVYAINPTHGTSFDHVGYPLEGATLTSATATASGLTGTLTGATTSTFELTYDDGLDAFDSALSYVTGSWRFVNDLYTSNLTIASDGVTSTTNAWTPLPSFNCNSAGAAQIIDADYGIYGWRTTPSGTSCSSTAELTGFAFLSDGAAPTDTITVLLASDAQFYAAKYIRQ